VSGIDFSLIQAVDNFKIGRFVPGSMLTPTGQVSFPARRAARSFRQNSSSCCRFIRPIRSSSALSKTASFHFITRPPFPIGAHLPVAEERGFSEAPPVRWSSQLNGVLLRRQSGRSIHLDGDNLILEPAFQRSPRTAFLLRLRVWSAFSAMEPLEPWWRAAKVAIGRSRTCRPEVQHVLSVLRVAIWHG